MKRNEMSAIHKIAVVVGWLCAITSLILSVLDLMGIVTDLDAIEHICWGIFCLSQGIACWSTQLKLSIFWFFLGGLYLLPSLIGLFT